MKEPAGHCSFPPHLGRRLNHAIAEANLNNRRGQRELLKLLQPLNKFGTRPSCRNGSALSREYILFCKAPGRLPSKLKSKTFRQSTGIESNYHQIKNPLPHQKSSTSSGQAWGNSGKAQSPSDTAGRLRKQGRYLCKKEKDDLANTQLNPHLKRINHLGNDAKSLSCGIETSVGT